MEALEKTLQDSLKLGKHTNVLHFTSHDVAKYLWCHSEYQPWSYTLSLQCLQFDATHLWIPVFFQSGNGYNVSCVAKNCDWQQQAEPHTFDVKWPKDKFIPVSKNYG